ncbi:Uncharacterised protein [Mycobacteroides abscessus subsp. abscessus]|nr:Uncharacterised protein [Mycobacteroides abscessus subsp. abscessus]
MPRPLASAGMRADICDTCSRTISGMASDIIERLDTGPRNTICEMFSCHHPGTASTRRDCETRHTCIRAWRPFWSKSLT